MCISVYRNAFFRWGLSLGLVLSVFQAEANQIVLKPGYWEYKQNTVVEGVSLPGTNIAGGECLLKEDENRALDYYVAKFKQGLGEDSNCTVSDLKHIGKEVTFNLRCISTDNMTSDHQIQYTYSLSRVDVQAEGVMNVAGRSFVTKSSATSNWQRQCTTEEKQAAEKARPANYTNVSLSSNGTALKIGPKGAGPISETLSFSKVVIQTLFPDARIEASQEESYGYIQPVFNIYEEGNVKPIFQVDGREGTNIAFSVFTQNSAVSGPYGERIGITTLGAVSSDNPHLCSFGENKLDKTLVCLIGDKFRSLYTLPNEILEKYDEVIPQHEIDKAVLSEMRYFLSYPKKSVSKKENILEEGIIKLSSDDFYNEFKAIKTDKPIVVHFTSTDSSCVHCIKNNLVFSQLHKEHAEKYTFAEVIFNPWKRYQKKFKRLRGLPATQLYLDKIEVFKISGYRENLFDTLQNAHGIINEILVDNYDDVNISKYQSSDLPGLVSANAQDKLLLIHLTSTENTCLACVKNNAFFRYAAREHAGQIGFTEVVYNPYSLVSSDEALKQYLKSQKIEIKGLPVTLIYKGNKSIGARPGMWTTISDDLTAFKRAN